MSSHEYDPDAPEGAGPGLANQHVTKRDGIIVAVLVLVLAVAFALIFPIMRRNSDIAACKQNMAKIGASIKIYSELNDQRFPPLYDVGAEQTPSLNNGMPIVWASVVPELPKGATFACPAAHAEENTKVNGKSLQTSMFSSQDKMLSHIEMSYGMFAPLSTRAVSDVAVDDQTFMLAETTNNGARGVYNPYPFKLSDGTVIPFDGFSIGFDNAHVRPDPESKRVTHLAFYGTADGDFGKKGIEARHQKLIFGIFVDGHLGKITPEQAILRPNDYTWMVR